MIEDDQPEERVMLRTPKNVLFISSAMTLNYEPGGEPAKAKR
jgi:hypothetical protein